MSTLVGPAHMPSPCQRQQRTKRPPPNYQVPLLAAVAYEEGKLGLLPVRDDVWELIIEDAAASDVAVGQSRLEVAQTQIAEDFFTPPLFADWISFTNLWYPILQGIILGDASVEDGLARPLKIPPNLLADLGYDEAGACGNVWKIPRWRRCEPVQSPMWVNPNTLDWIKICPA